MMLMGRVRLTIQAREHIRREKATLIFVQPKLNGLKRCDLEPLGKRLIDEKSL